MPLERKGARFAVAGALPRLLAVALFVCSGTTLARADETTPPPAAPSPAAEKSASGEVVPVSAAVPVPAPAVAPDSAAAAPAVRDSSVKAPDAADAHATEAPPAESNENATTSQPEKTVEAAPAPKALAKPVDAAAKRAAPGAAAKLKPGAKPGTGGSAARGMRGGAKKSASTKPIPGTQANAVVPTVMPHEGLTEADRVASELERTERFVSRAQKSILTSKNTRAMKLFTSALDFQSDSRDACKVMQYARAERLTLAARDFADRASRMVGPPREDPDYVDHVLRRTDDALDRAKDVLRTGAGRDAWRQHEDLKQEQKDAWKVFKGGDVVGAYKETLGVREGVLALLRQLQDLPVPRETAEKAIGGAQMALDQANKELGPKPSVEAVQLVRLANEYLAKARQSFSRGSYRSALLQAKVVERHVEHAVDVGRPQSG